MSRFNVLTDHPVAWESRDHTHPGGTMMDNSRNHAFNEKLYALFPGRAMAVLDLGCAGGGFVKDCIDDGHAAVGIEGSDYSLVRKRAEWATIPENLFTADITHPFRVQWGGDITDGRNEECWAGEDVAFEAVTAWEVMEHIPEAGLPGLCDNVRRHLTADGLWIMSVSLQRGFHHMTVRPRTWWLGMFAREGFANRDDLVAYFQNDWVRGPLQGAPESFHLVLGRTAGRVPG